MAANRSVSDLSSEEIILLQAIGGSSTPVGSRRAADALRGAGITVSESTVSRLLRRLDGEKLTEAQETKGRILTEEGRRLLLTLNERDRREQILRDASGVSDISDLLDLLYARRGVEREAVCAAARRATDADIARLQELVADH
jgi:DNA-binding FadR family transcriptional regulator